MFVKVRLADIVRPVRAHSRSAWQSAFTRIGAKHVDFQLCNPSSLSVALVVELDDRSHQTMDRGARDSLVDSALWAAHIPVLRLPARASYVPAQVREEVTRALRAKPKPS